jgi:transcriptional regulator with XRE-family HTH domain
MNLQNIGKQIAAARALADWSAAELGERAGLTKDAVLKIEAGAVQPRAGTVADITAALAKAGIEFIERGVRLADDAIKVLEGDDAYLKMLDDIYYAVHKTGGEVLFFYSNDRHTRAGEYEAEVRIRDAGGRFRSLVEEGITTTAWPVREYRQISKKYFNHDLQVIYADNVAQAINGGEKIVLIRNASLATTARNTFNLIWSLMPPVRKAKGEHG